jgi:hypothetical protein
MGIVDELYNGERVNQFIDNFIKSKPIIPANVGNLYSNLLKSGAEKSKFSGDRLFDRPAGGQRAEDIAFVERLPKDAPITFEEMESQELFTPDFYRSELYKTIKEHAINRGIKVMFTRGFYYTLNDKKVKTKEPFQGIFYPRLGQVVINLNETWNSYQKHLDQFRERKIFPNIKLLDNVALKGLKSFEDYVQYIFTHEMIHAVSSNVLEQLDSEDKNKYVAEELNEVQINAAEKLEAIRKYLDSLDKEKYFGRSSVYALENKHELLAGLSDLNFIEAISKIPLPEELRYEAKTPNVFESILKFLTELLTGKKVDNNAADSVYAALNDIITTRSKLVFDPSLVTFNTDFSLPDTEKVIGKFYDQNPDAGGGTLPLPSVGTRVSIKDEKGEYNDYQIRTTFEPLLRLFFMNNYLNGYHLNQLFTGAYDEFANTEDLVKRMTGVLAPGIKPFISPWGSKPNYNLGIIRDTLLKRDSEGNVPKQMLSFVERSYPGITEDRKNVLLSFFRKVETTDGQGFISKKRIAELKAAYGDSYDVGNILKPVYFGTSLSKYPFKENLNSEDATKAIEELKQQYPGAQFDQFITVETQNGITNIYKNVPKTVYIKYSAVHLDDSLLERYPELKAFDKYMEDNNIDELVFPSAIKIGAPKGDMLTDLDAQSLIDHYMNEDRTLKNTSRLLANENGLSTISLENKYYKMQFNPKSSVGENKVTVPSQLQYFVNLFKYNERESRIAFETISEIINLQTREAIKSLTGESSTKGLNRYQKGKKESYKSHNRRIRAIEKKLTTQIGSKLTSAGSEYYKDFVDAGISTSNPILYDKVYSQIMSTIENMGIRIKLPGGKMIMQSDANVKITDPKTGQVRELESYEDSNSGKYYSEVVISREILSDEMYGALQRGEDIFASAEVLGFRIPTTEVHSAIPMKIVGVHDDQNTNLVIAPFNTVYILGADFDVDSLFVVRRNLMPKNISKLLGLEDGHPVGYQKINGKYHFPDPRLNPSNVYDGQTIKFPLINEYLAKLNDLIEEEKKKLTSNKELQKPAEIIKAIEKSIKKLEGYKEELRILNAKNALFEAFASAVQKKPTRERMLTPILMSTFNDLNDPTSVASKLREVHPQLWADDLLGDLTDLNSDFDSFSVMQSGKKLTGHFANAIKVLAYINKAGESKEIVKVNKYFTLSYKIDDQTVVYDTLDTSPKL